MSLSKTISGNEKMQLNTIVKPIVKLKNEISPKIVDDDIKFKIFIKKIH